MVYWSQWHTSIGDLVAVADEDQLSGLYIRGQKHQPALDPDWQRNDHCAVISQAREQLDEYLSGRCQQFELSLSPQGTAFQQQVWQALSAIPYGQTVSYRELAERVNKPNGARAVAAAVGRNPLLIIVPCHRVVGSDGALTGYAAGIERKRLLLNLEKA